MSFNISDIFIDTIQIFSTKSYDYSGWSVSNAGDFNNDGYDDIIIGAPYSKANSRNSAGTSYLIFGRASGFADIDLSSDLASDSVGFKVFIYIHIANIYLLYS